MIEESEKWLKKKKEKEQGPDKFDMGNGLYAVNTRKAAGTDTSAMKRRADYIHQQVKENFDPSKVQRMDEDKKDWKKYAIELERLIEKIILESDDDDIREKYREVIREYDPHG